MTHLLAFLPLSFRPNPERQRGEWRNLLFAEATNCPTLPAPLSARARPEPVEVVGILPSYITQQNPAPHLAADTNLEERRFIAELAA